MLSARCHDPRSVRVLGDAWLRAGGSYSSAQDTNLVYSLARSQLLYRVRLKSVVQSRDLSRQGIDEHLGRMELPPGGVRITDGPKCSSHLVDQHGPGDGRISAQLGLCDDRRYSSEVSHRSSVRRRLPGSVLRRSSQCVCCCRQRSWAVPFQASRPGGKHPGGFPCRPPPGAEIRYRDRSQSLERSFDCRHRPSPIIGVTT